jgi:hypothetical protein
MCDKERSRYKWYQWRLYVKDDLAFAIMARAVELRLPPEKVCTDILEAVLLPDKATLEKCTPAPDRVQEAE